jgi:hypothetical protein
MGQSSGVLIKEVAAFGRCPLIEVSLFARNHIDIYGAVYRQHTSFVWKI